ncbi:MAG: hypothetical protein IT186_21445 [Acidobacteria bacterium]|nr:hypothetical protein [Acidobacteriota bacterium]
MSETFEKLRDDFADEIAKGVEEDKSRIERLSTLAYRALSVKADAAQDQTKRADEIATGVSDLKAKSGVQPPMIREYAKLGFLLKDVPTLVSKCGGRVARKVAPLVEFDKTHGAWSIDANHLERLKAWVASDNPHDAAGAMALREDCGKVAAPRAKKAKDETPAPGPLPVSDETVGAYFASRATEGVIDDMVKEASNDQREDIGRALARHLSPALFVQLVKEFLCREDAESPDGMLAFHAIGRELTIEQTVQVVDGFAAVLGENDGADSFSEFVSELKRIKRERFGAVPVAA